VLSSPVFRFAWVPQAGTDHFRVDCFSTLMLARLLIFLSCWLKFKSTGVGTAEAQLWRSQPALQLALPPTDILVEAIYLLLAVCCHLLLFCPAHLVFAHLKHLARGKQNDYIGSYL
jgi:hypothetical protein